MLCILHRCIPPKDQKKSGDSCPSGPSDSFELLVVMMSHERIFSDNFISRSFQFKIDLHPGNLA